LEKIGIGQEVADDRSGHIKQSICVVNVRRTAAAVHGANLRRSSAPP